MDKPLWGLKVLKFDGAIAPRVLKFDSGSAAEGCGGRLILLKAPFMIKPNNRASPEGNHTTALTDEKMQSPLWCRKAPKGGLLPEVADYRSAYHNV